LCKTITKLVPEHFLTDLHKASLKHKVFRPPLCKTITTRTSDEGGKGRDPGGRKGRNPEVEKVEKPFEPLLLNRRQSLRTIRQGHPTKVRKVEIQEVEKVEIQEVEKVEKPFEPLLLNRRQSLRTIRLGHPTKVEKVEIQEVEKVEIQRSKRSKNHLNHCF